jgi:hypothetical protein
MTITHIVNHNPVIDAKGKFQLIIARRMASCKCHLMIHVFNIIEKRTYTWHTMQNCENKHQIGLPFNMILH